MSEFIDGVLRRVERGSYLPSDVDALANEAQRLTRERDEWKAAAQEYAQKETAPDWASDEIARLNARLAAVPALVEALRYVQPLIAHADENLRVREKAIELTAEALAAYEQAQG